MASMRSLSIVAALAAPLIVAAGGCATVTLSQESERQIAAAANYEERKDFFLWGLVGEHEVDVTEVCGNRAPAQLQTQMTVADSLLGFVTLGIYAPRTAKVWCQ